MLDHDEMLPEEQQSPELLEELIAIYQIASEEEQMLTRVHQRLEGSARASLPASSDGIRSLSEMPLRPVKPVSSTSPSLPGGSLFHRVNLLAAVLLVALLVTSLASTFALLNGSKNITSSSPSTLPVKHVVELYDGLRFKMVTATTGWMLGDTRQSSYSTLLHTTDSGRHWQNVTPSDAKIVDDLFVLDENIAWLPSTSPSLLASKAEFIRTVNGGKTWQPIVSPVKGSATLTFTDENNGWLLAIPSDGKGNYCTPSADQGVFLCSISTKVPVRQLLYYTSDGGVTWQSRGTTPVLFDNVQFFDNTTGWATSDEFQAPQPKLYSTTDGGKHWTGRNLPIAYEEKPDAFLRWVKMLNFVNASEWYLLGQVAYTGKPNAGVSYYVYHTRDAGANWNIVGSALPAAFVDVRAIFDDQHSVQAGVLAIAALTLINGHWHTTTWNLPEKGELVDSGFVSLQISFVLIAPSPGKIMDFYVTVDGGKSWQKRASLYLNPEAGIN